MMALFVKYFTPSIGTRIKTALILLFIASISIAPNATRKPVLSVDGSVVMNVNGRLLTEFDSAASLKSNWFSVTLIGFALALLVSVVIRLLLKLAGKIGARQGERL